MRDQEISMLVLDLSSKQYEEIRTLRDAAVHFNEVGSLSKRGNSAKEAGWTIQRANAFEYVPDSETCLKNFPGFARQPKLVPSLYQLKLRLRQA